MKKILLHLFVLLGFLSTAHVNIYKTTVAILAGFDALVSVCYAMIFSLLIDEEYDFNRNNRLVYFNVKALDSLLLNI